ncbi:signal transducer and activator of transcription 1-alpha/beta-like [Anarrhichthys ocellatus]|uniref:signal transducer and activator of transcription 1-alpha/beta-like n=1 Tax=Anarrhichthys ocellatus TaxID=433405 RepID=UPI0012ED08D6|nr:signal transducer and activator of transcription 1-alpha/beta-like [Anarrhichthys ocellatus]
MAQWQDLLKLDSVLQARVSQLYERKFPREIRQCLCVPIESQDWDSAAVDENKASICFHVLLEYLEDLRNCSVQENNILQGPNFSGMKDYLLKHFEDKPLNLAVILSESLKEENKILALASEAQGCSSLAMNQTWKELDNNVNELKKQTSEVKKEMMLLEFLNENVDFIQKTWPSQVEQHIGLAKSHAVVEEECLKRTNLITQKKQMVLQQISNILNLAQKIVATLTDVELPEWKRRQQMACIGSPADASLDHLQKWFTTVAETLLQVREQLQKLQDQNKKYKSADASSLTGPMAEIEKFTLSLLTKLLANALVVEKQPIMSSLPQRPLILKTGVRFSVTVRFLANLPEFKYLLKVKPVFDKDVEEAKTLKGFRHFDFNKDDSKVLDMDSLCGGFVAEFGHMSLKERKARTKGSHVNHLLVTEELHIIKFVTGFQHAGLEFNIEASSLPVVVISSTNQGVNAWASVMWYNMLSAGEPPNLSLFVDPPPLSWQQLSQVLSWQFMSVGQRELDENQLSMLRDKILDDPDGLVQWSKFSKNENAWIWIDGILDLIKTHLVNHWRDGSIMGFVSRERTKVLLQEKQTGTFLLRFSESNKEGAISFSWVDHCNDDAHVHAVEPYTKSELSGKALPDIIYNYSLRAERTHRNPLIYLYPDIHKDAVFGRYYNAPETPATKKIKDDYVKRNNIPTSDSPTPPPSPPREMTFMDMDMDMDMDTDIKLVDLLDLPELPDLFMSFQEASTETNFETNFVDFN